MKPAILFKRALLTILCFAVLGGCAEHDGTEIPDPGPDVPRELEQSTHSLAEGRQVDVIPVAGLSAYEPDARLQVDPRTAVRGVDWAYASKKAVTLSWLDLVVATCDIQVRSVYGDPTDAVGAQTRHLGPTSPVPMAESGFFVPRDGGARPMPRPAALTAGGRSPVGLWSSDYSDGGWITQALLMCAGQRALELAQALRPKYIVGFFPKAGTTDPNAAKAEWIIASDSKTEWPVSWKEHERLLQSMAPTKAFSLPTWDERFKVLFEIPASDAAQAATWALIAVDFFRESALMGNQVLKNHTDLATYYAELPDGKRLTLQESVVGALSDSLMGMEDAAERAELYVAAATSSEDDLQSSRVSRWRGRFGSRLEAARVFAGIAPTLFEGSALVPLIKLSGALADGTAKTAVTTDTATLEALWVKEGVTLKGRSVIGYIYPSYLPQPEGTQRLLRMRHKTNGNWWTVAESQIATTASAGDYSRTGEVTEGYIASSGLDPAMLDVSVAGAAGALTLGVGSTQSTTSGQPAIFGKIVGNGAGTATTYNVEPPTLAGTFPVVTSVSQSNKDRIAEKLIRSLRVSPIQCSAGVPGPGIQCNARLSNKDLVQDMRLAETGRINKANFWANDEDYLREMLLTPEDVLRAALRIRQEAEVLGRAITPEPPQLDGVIRVRGTRKDFAPVEPAYLQARTDGATRFESAGTNESLDVEFARRGVYQAALYLRQQLQGYSPTHAGVAATVGKIRDWADTLVTGYVRITMTRGAGINLDVNVSEMRPGPGVYELWVGEDGLECALKGTISGLGCTESNYRVAAQTFTAATPVEVRIAGQTIVDARLKSGARVYLTKDLGAKRRAVVGFTLTGALGATTEWRRLPLMSQAVADAYTRTLAADPTDSYRAEKYCNGLIDYDVRVKLEDELTEESALKYSLKRARVAAERADTLGSNVVDLGLGLDERAELARDQLEDLCGVTSDLPDLNTTVSSSATPQQGKVELPSVDTLNTSEGSAGLDACLTPESKLEWISLGESAHCVWELEGQAPCECGANIDCQNWIRDQNATCPVSPLVVNSGGVDRTGPQAVSAGTASASCGEWYRANGNLPANVPFKFRALETAGNKVQATTLGQLALNDLPATVDRPAGWENAANRCEMLAALYDGAFKNKSDAEVRHAFPWLDYDTVRDTARAIGLRVDPMGRFELTLDGETWLKVGSRKPEPLAGERSVYDRRYWPGVTTPWPISAKVQNDVCSKPNAKEELLYCRGTDDPDGSATALSGGEREAVRIDTALGTLAHLTGAEGPREYWEWDSAGEKLGFNKENVTDVIQITDKDPEGRGGAFGYQFVPGGAPTTSDDIFFGVDGDDQLLMATDLGSRSGGTGGYPIPDRTYKVEGSTYKYSEIAEPWNWQKSAGFINVREEADVDPKFDADEFLTHSTLWKVLRNPDASESHTAIEWKYHKPRKSKWWEKAGDWVTLAVATDILSGGGLGGIAATDPVLGTIAAANLGRRIFSRNVGRWKSTEWPITRTELFDAFSLVCMALDKRDGAGPVQSTDSCADYFPEQPTMRDAANAADCAAGRVGRQINELYIPGLPSALKSMVTHEGDGLTQVLPQFAGQYAEAASALVSDVEIYRTSMAAISRSLNDLGYHTRTLDRTVKRLENESKVANIQLRKDIANQITACVVAGASAAGLDFAAAAGKGAAATATCANAAVQSLWSTEIEKLQQDNIDISESQAIDDFKEAVENVLTRIDEQMLAVRQAHARVHADIATMQGIRHKAKRAAARATLAWDLGNGRVNNVNAVMRARMNTAIYRYDEAWRQAVRYGFLARKAVEQRFGLELDTMTHRMSLFGETGAGQAPYQWADSICYKRGIDYERIRSGQGEDNNSGQGEGNNATGTPAQAFADSKAGYAESYISDYVTKLEDFIDSYRVDFPFQEGADSVVISVRDELQGVRRLDCPVQGNNLLLNTAEPTSGLGLWECGVGVPCASLRPLNESGPFDCERNRCEPWQQGARPAQLTPASNVTPVVPVAGTPAPPPPYIAQTLVVDPGRYTASWYERCNANAASVRLRVTEPSVGTYVPAPTFYEPTCSCANTTNCDVRSVTKVQPDGSTQVVRWVRRIANVSFPNRGAATFGFEVTPPGDRPRAAAVIAAPQLEAGPTATQYFPTDDDNISPVGVCEDASGDKFRSWDIWTYGCETYCPAGYGLDCKQHIPEAELPRSCYYETRFSISQEDIERGKLIQEAGFSKGNFNYRIKNVAINFVGTGVKDCGGAELASACYGGNFLQYTLQQSGPFRVRNFEGDLYAAPLFVGKVQMAKGLTAERYLTNPLSSADQNLLGTYYRSEFRERPIEGTYTLRVYDTEHLKWSRLEDIQLIVNYDYWTRSPESTH